MKKALLPLLFLFIFIGQTNAQIKLKIGPRVGFNIASLSYDPEIYSAPLDAGSKFAFLFGGVLELKFPGFFAIQIEPTYIQKGDKVTGGPVAVNGQQVNNLKLTTNVSELEIPILAKVVFPAGPVKPYGILGPAIGFILSTSQDLEADGQSRDLETPSSSVDFGLLFGGGVEFTAAPLVTLTFDIRYALGFTNVSENDQPSVKTKGLQFAFGALFGL